MAVDYRPDIEPSNVRPSMGTYNTPQTFRFWCQKVLPLVYDDSLSYYELLCKVVDYLNKTMEDVNTAVEDVTNLNSAFGSLENHVNASETALLQAYTDLQTYVNDYFDNLDVQEEINNKLDAMVADGTMDTIILPYFNEYVEDANAQIEEYKEASTATINNAIEEQNDNIFNQGQRIGTVESELNNLIAVQTAGTMQGKSLTTFVATSRLQYTQTSGSQDFAFFDYTGHQNVSPSISTLDSLVNPVLVSCGAYVSDVQGETMVGKPLYINLGNNVKFYPSGGYSESAPAKKAVVFSIPVQSNGFSSLTNKWLRFTFTVASDAPTDLTEITNARIGNDGVTYATLGSAIREQINALNIGIINAISPTPIEKTGLSQNYALNSGGSAVANENYDIDKYAVTAGQVYYVKVNDDLYWQFQSGTSASSRVGTTNKGCDGFVEVPTGATYLAITVPKNNTITNVSTIQLDISDIEEEIEELNSEITSLNKGIFSTMYTAKYEKAGYSSGYRLDAGGNGVLDSDYNIDKYSVNEGEIYYVKVDNGLYWQLQGTTQSSTKIGQTYNGYDGFIEVPAGAHYIAITSPINGTGDNVYVASSTNELLGKKVAVYGDSWSSLTMSYHVWQDAIADLTKIPLHVVATGGYKMSQINDSFDDYVADIYIIEGGINDWINSTGFSEFKNALTGLITKIRGVNPNAEIYVINLARQLAPTSSVITTYDIKTPCELYRQLIWSICLNNHVYCISGLKTTNFTVYSDGLHPLPAEAEMLAPWIINGILHKGDTRDYMLQGFIHSVDGIADYSITMEGVTGVIKVYGNKTYSSGTGCYVEIPVIGALLSNNYNSQQIGLDIIGGNSKVVRISRTYNGIEAKPIDGSTGVGTQTLEYRFVLNDLQ